MFCTEQSDISHSVFILFNQRQESDCGRPSEFYETQRCLVWWSWQLNAPWFKQRKEKKRKEEKRTQANSKERSLAIWKQTHCRNVNMLQIQNKQQRFFQSEITHSFTPAHSPGIKFSIRSSLVNYEKCTLRYLLIWLVVRGQRSRSDLAIDRFGQRQFRNCFLYLGMSHGFLCLFRRLTAETWTWCEHRL